MSNLVYQTLKEHFLGQDWAIQWLAQAVTAETLSQSLLITGVPQLGKATLGRLLAMALACQAPNKPCMRCPSCLKVQSGNHPDVTIIEPADSNDKDTLKIEDVRQIQRDLTLKPHECRYKITVLGDFDRATTSAANALLKTLEEPPAHVILILTAPRADSLLPTIVSRCQVIGLRPVPPEALRHFLQTRHGLEESQATLLSRLAQGRPGWAIKAIHQPEILTRRTAQLADLLELTSHGYAFRLAYAQNFFKNGQSPAETLGLWLLWWRDVLLVNQGTPAGVINFDQLQNLHWFAQNLSAPAIAAIIKQTGAALQNINYNVNERLNLETLLLNLPHLKPQPA